MEAKDILYAIYCKKTGMNIFDLLYESSLQYEKLKPLLDEWVSQGILRTEDGRHYEFIGNARMFSGKYKKERQKRFIQERMRGTVYEDRDPEDESNEDDEEKDRKIREAYLESYGREFITGRRTGFGSDEEDAEGHDEDDEASGDADDLFELRLAQKITAGGSCGGDDDEEDILQTEDALRKCIFDNIIENIALIGHGENYVVEIKGLNLCKTDAKFELFPRDGKIYLCDQGATLCGLEETVELNDTVCKQIARVASESGAEFMDGKLCLEVVSAEQTLAYFFRLYAVMERIYHIKDCLPGKTDNKEAVPEEYIKALEYIVQAKKASISDLYAKFGFSPQKIGLMFEWMEEEGFITAFNDGTKEREVLLTLDQFKSLFGKK